MTGEKVGLNRTTDACVSAILADPSDLQEMLMPEDQSAAAVFAALVDGHDEWTAALVAVGASCAGGRDRLIAAEVALTRLEELATQAGLLLADALTGRAPAARDELLRLLAPDSAVSAAPAADVVQTLVAAKPVEASVERAPDASAGATTANPPHVEDVVPATQAAAPPAVPLTDAAVALLKAKMSGELQTAPTLTARAKAQHEALDALRKKLGSVPAQLTTRDQLAELLQRVEQTVAEVQTWNRLGPHGRRMLVEGIAARIRAIQDVEGGTLGPDEVLHRRTGKVMRELRKETTDGKIDRSAWGLALKHDAQSGSWLGDAQQLQLDLEQELGVAPAEPPQPARFSVDDAFRRLREDLPRLTNVQLSERLHELLAHHVPATDKRFVRILEPRLADVVHDRSLSRVTRAVAAALAVEDVDEGSVKSIDANWYGFAYTAGKAAVIVGGDSRQESMAAMKGAFRFASIEWADTPKNSPGKANALVNQVRKGNHEIVICLQQFIAHKLTDELFAIDRPDVVVVLAQGYGILQVRLALERYLPRPR